MRGSLFGPPPPHKPLCITPPPPPPTTKMSFDDYKERGFYFILFYYFMSVFFFPAFIFPLFIKKKKEHKKRDKMQELREELFKSSARPDETKGLIGGVQNPNLTFDHIAPHFVIFRST